MLAAFPFAISFLMLPFVVAGAAWGGWFTALPFLAGWVAVSLLDKIFGLDTSNLDPASAARRLGWHRAVTLAWLPAQLAMIVICLYAVSLPNHLSTGEQFALMAGLGVATGTIGITYAHELIHRRARIERLAGEALLVTTLYGHFATEHIAGHHLHVATPADPVSARRGESLYAFLPRALIGTLRSAWRIETERLTRRGLSVWHRRNPFWRYGLGAGAALALAWAMAGGRGVGLYVFMAAVAVLQLEAVNYVEHYGLTRRHLGGRRFERAGLHHSWNAAHKVSNLLLINLQRHSDHHAHPNRRFALLEHHPWKAAPQLPFGYAVMIFAALLPPLWFRIMDPRLMRWRQQFYPDIVDWGAYEDGSIMPRNPSPSRAA